jgi:co-chaperonin GroES (HSP10)
MKTLTDIIVVEQDEVPQLWHGLYIPDVVRDNTEVGIYKGTVTCVGPDCKVLKVGSRIIFHRSVCAPLEYEGKPFRALHEKEVIGLLEDEYV